MEGKLLRAQLRRPLDGPEWTPGVAARTFDFGGGRGWQSNGGPSKRHPARGLPFSLEVPVPEFDGRLNAIHLAGVFALFGDTDEEPDGSLGAVIQVQSGPAVLHRVELVKGRHYGSCGAELTPLGALEPGLTLRTLDTCLVDGSRARVDVLRIELPSDAQGLTHITFRDLGTPASFVLFDVLFEAELVPTCPFRGQGAHVGLSEIGGILRLRDRFRFDRALRQLRDGILASEGDLDEARGLALTFLAVVSASRLEAGTPRRLHRFQLEAARSLDRQQTAQEIWELARAGVDDLTSDLFPRSGQVDTAIHQALAIIDRDFAQPITDSEVAEKVGISTSHFRYLFRQTTQQPFHRYVMAQRLEKARDMLMTTPASVAEISDAVGFASPAHFSRAFSSRFGLPPSELRQANRVGSP